MKLRNKKTGEIIDLDEWSFDSYNDKLYIARGDAEGDNIEYFNSLADLCSKYEDYTPTEPIKDDKMRQCLKLWSEINGFKGELTYAERQDWCSFYEQEKDEELLFRNRNCQNLKNGEAYTIAELCGEED